MAIFDGRINEFTFKVVSLVFFGTAILATAARMIIRLWFLRGSLRLDDYLLLASCVFLTGATAALCYGTTSIFLATTLTYNPSAVPHTSMSGAVVVQNVDLFIKISWTYLALSWASIFFVKFGFLSLFKHLVDRLPLMLRLWRAALAFTALVFVIAECNGFMNCANSGIAVVHCSTNANAREKALGIGFTVMILDISTDVIIIAIPVYLLWRVRIKKRQKLGLAAFLCLSVCMIMMAAIRASGFSYRGKFDKTWVIFWQQMEACVAVIMFSLTSFRSVFVAAKPVVHNRKLGVPISSKRRLFEKSRKPSTGGHQRLDDLAFPSATSTLPNRVYNQTNTESTADGSSISTTRVSTSEIEH